MYCGRVSHVSVFLAGGDLYLWSMICADVGSDHPFSYSASGDVHFIVLFPDMIEFDFLSKVSTFGF